MIDSSHKYAFTSFKNVLPQLQSYFFKLHRHKIVEVVSVIGNMKDIVKLKKLHIYAESLK